MFQIFRALANNLELLNFALNFYIYCLCRWGQPYCSWIYSRFSTYFQPHFPLLWQQYGLSETFVVANISSCIAVPRFGEPLFPFSTSAPACSRGSRRWVRQPEAETFWDLVKHATWRDLVIPAGAWRPRCVAIYMLYGEHYHIGTTEWWLMLTFLDHIVVKRHIAIDPQS